MTNFEGSAHPSSAHAYELSGRALGADTPKDDFASEGAAAFGDTKASVQSVIADATEKGQQALNYAGKKGQEAIGNVRGIGDTLGVAIEKSVTTRPYTTLALAVAAGFLFGATWRR
jgi:4-aminobutyrate aminotransferase-like enzyme